MAAAYVSRRSFLIEEGYGLNVERGDGTVAEHAGQAVRMDPDSIVFVESREGAFHGGAVPEKHSDGCAFFEAGEPLHRAGRAGSVKRIKSDSYAAIVLRGPVLQL